jgi:oligopeptide transport system substrate-binding protein
METGAICPLYYYTDIYMRNPVLEGAFASPLGFKYFMYSTVAE